MAPKRTRGFGVALIAGTIESISGSARAAPAPRSTARRERCRRVMKFAISSPSSLACRETGTLRSHLGPVTERYALHDTQNQRAEPEVFALSLPDDGAHGRHVVILDRAPEC